MDPYQDFLFCLWILSDVFYSCLWISSEVFYFCLWILSEIFHSACGSLLRFSILPVDPYQDFPLCLWILTKIFHFPVDPFLGFPFCHFKVSVSPKATEVPSHGYLQDRGVPHHQRCSGGTQSPGMTRKTLPWVQETHIYPNIQEKGLVSSLEAPPCTGSTYFGSVLPPSSWPNLDPSLVFLRINM